MPLVSLMSETDPSGDKPLHRFDLCEVPQIGEEISVTALDGGTTIYEVADRRFAVDLREGILADNSHVTLYVREPDMMSFAAEAMIDGRLAAGEKSPGPRGPVPRDPGDNPPVEVPKPPPMPNPNPGGV